MIESLTAEQEAKFDFYKEKWRKIGLSTEPANREIAEEGLKEAYETAGLAPPNLVIWVDCPVVGMKIQSIVSNNENVKNLFLNTPSADHPALIKKVVEEYKSEKTDLYWSCYGQFEAFWFSFYDFVGTELGIDTSKIQGLKKICENAGWYWVFDDFAVITERPLEIHIENDELHNLDGPSMIYRDGLKVYSYRGVSVPEWVIMEKDKITPDRIKEESNAELRRVLISIYGLDKWIVNGGFKPIHKDDRGELYEDNEGRKVVKVICSTKGISYFIPVPPNVNSASEAVAGTFGLDEDEYKPEIET